MRDIILEDFKDEYEEGTVKFAFVADVLEVWHKG